MESYPSEASGGTDMLDIKSVHMEFPVDANIIVGQAHFIKTVEDRARRLPSELPPAARRRTRADAFAEVLGRRAARAVADQPWAGSQDVVRVCTAAVSRALSGWAAAATCRVGVVHDEIALAIHAGDDRNKCRQNNMYA
jgi:hypothetical protein